MAFTGLEDLNVTDVGSILSYPLTGDPYFWTKIFLALWVILTSILFFEEQNRVGKGNFLSSIAFSGVAVLVLVAIGTLLRIVNNEILIGFLVAVGAFVFVWYIKSDK